MSGGFGLPVLSGLGQQIAGIGTAYDEAFDRERKKAVLASLGAQLKGGDYAGAAAAALDAGELGPGVALLKLGAERDRDARQQANSALVFGPGGVGGLYGDGSGQAQPGLGARSDASLPSFSDTSGPSGSFAAALATRESGNNASARNPLSSATGLGQFTDRTWAGVMRQHPELGLTADGRTDPDQSRRAIAAHAADNGTTLQRSGLPVNDSSLYALHFLGAGGGRRFVAGTLADPSRPATSLASPEQVAANRSVFFDRDGTVKSAGDVMNDFARSFGGGRRSGSRVATAAPSVDVAEDEAGVQALERRMGMTPRQVASADPAADMPASGAFEASLPGVVSGMDPGGVPPAVPSISGSPMASRIPPSITGNGRLLPSSDPNARNAPAPDVPTLGGPAPAGRTMTDPTAPVQVAQAGGRALAGDPEAAEFQRRLGGLSSGQRIQVLLQAGGMDLPDHHRDLIKTLLSDELQQAKMPDDVKQYMLARSQGFGGSLIDYKNELRKPLAPTTLAPGTSVYDPRTNTIAITAPGGRGERDEGDKLREQVRARREMAGSLGLEEGSPSWRSYVATGKVGADRDMSAGEKKMVEAADAAALASQTAIGQLEQAKGLSAKAYAGPLAGYRGQLTGAFGLEAGQTTTELDNVVTGSALAQLKTIFGAAPTEGERRILLDIQGSSNLPHALRLKVYDRAIDLARLKLEQQTAKADAIREGRYFRQGGGAAVRDAGSPSGAPALPAPPPSNRPGASSAADRFGQLVGSGLSKSQAYERLHQEGY